MRTAREGWNRWISDWNALDDHRRRTWGRAFGTWLLVSLATTVLLVWIGAELVAPQIGAWEERFLERLDGQEVVSFNAALWLEAFGNGFILWTVVLLATGVAAWLRAPLVAATLLFGFGSLYLNIVVGWLLWPRERPELIAGGIASPGSLAAYPSGHVAQATFVYGLLAFLWLRRSRARAEQAFGVLAVVLLVATVGFGRLRLGAHWPSDAVAGLIVGGVWLAGSIHALAPATDPVPRRAGDCDRG